MTVALTSTIIMLGPRPADSNAGTGTVLPINLSHREYLPFQLWRLTQSWRTALEHRVVQTNKSLSARGRQARSNINGTLA